MTENKSTDFDEIKYRIDVINNNIKEYAIKYNRNLNDISIMAVTKTRTPQEVNQAIKCGINLIGENKAQELNEKFSAYKKDNLDIHFIGHLQQNKVRQIVDKVSMIHSVDSIRLANEINTQCQKIQKTMDILVEVNIGDEDSKFGISPDNLLDFCYQLTKYSNLKLRGLMAIPPKASEYQVEKYFENMYKLYIDIRDKKMDNSNINVLSMGMSEDYKYGIKYGSSIIRIGTGIFGERNYNICK